MEQKRLIIITLVTMSIAFAIFMSVQYILSQLQLKDAVGQISVQKADRKTLIFAKLFVDKFLLAQGTVGFEDRLKLENAVRDINDPAIFKQWQKFTDSTDDREAQTAAGDLFNLLFNRLEK